MRIAALQIDSVVGDLEANGARIVEQALRAHSSGAALAVTPELALVGYPPRDLLVREGFVEACRRATAEIAQKLHARGAGGLAVVMGTPWTSTGMSRKPANAAVMLRDGAVEAVYRKRLLPTYDVFDESRYFEAGDDALVAKVAGKSVAILLCEDLWKGEDVDESHGYSEDPVAEAARSKVDLVVVPSASPFFAGKHARRMELLGRAAAAVGAPVMSVNAAGSNDDFVFDGGSCLVGPSGATVLSPRFAEHLLVAECGMRVLAAPESLCEPEELARAIVSAIEGYTRKTGHSRVLLGLSGGIDSAVVAALAVAALGADRVRGISMPGPHSSQGSVDDALESSKRLGLQPPDRLPIGEAYATLKRGMSLAAPIDGLTDENLQSRLRGLTLMTLSNATGALVLSTGNKSELAVGYATLYGDMCGGLAPLGDLLKGQVYAMARWMNENPSVLGLHAPPIPESSLTKAPSAELRPNQTDQDSLPPYDALDAIVTGFVDLEQAPTSIARDTGLPLALVESWTKAIDRAHYKRAQAPVIPKLSARAFGPGRRLPLAMRYRLGGDSSVA